MVRVGVVAAGEGVVKRSSAAGGGGTGRIPVLLVSNAPNYWIFNQPFRNIHSNTEVNIQVN